MNQAVQSRNIALGVAVIYMTIGLLGAMMVSGGLVTSKSVSTSGVLATANLGVYSDSACTQSLASVDWGTVSPGGSVSRTVYVKNLGNSQVTLSLSATNWNPSAANGPVGVGWNRQGAALAAGYAISAMLTLSVSSDAGGFTSFSVDAVITGTG